MMNDNQTEMVDDIITFFKRLGASNELSDRNFDTGEFLSLDYCNFIYDLAKKYDLYDKIEETKDVNYVVTLEDNLTAFFRGKLLESFSNYD